MGRDLNGNMHTIELHDTASGTSATILAGFGFNCYSFIARHDDENIELLWSVPNFASGQERPSRSGIPILFPFPGRIAGTTFHFQGREYPLEAADGQGNAIHGFVLNRPWRVIDQGSQHAVGQFQASQDDPSLLSRWPADFRITVRYELAGNRLLGEYELHNPDTKPLPMGLGLHPYFRVPLLPGSQGDECRVSVPAEEYWELKDLIATGRRLPVSGDKDVRSGMRFADTRLDNIFWNLDTTGGRVRTQLEDAAAGCRLEIDFDAWFRGCVVFNPPHREAVCIEPYSCVPDAWRLAERGIDAGELVLPPGETLRTWMEIRFVD
jgi:aldose 1-epimerase